MLYNNDRVVLSVSSRWGHSTDLKQQTDINMPLDEQIISFATTTKRFFRSLLFDNVTVCPNYYIFTTTRYKEK